MNPILMAVVLLAGLGVFAFTAVNRTLLALAARAPDHRLDRLPERLRGVLLYMFGQLRMFRYRAAGLAHALIFGGFVVLGLRTVILAARGFSSDPHFGFWLFDDDAPLGLAYLFLKDLVGVGVIAGVGYFLWLRLAVRPGRLTLSGEGIFILLMILSLMIADMTYEATGYVADTRPALAPLIADPLAAAAALPRDLHGSVFHAATPFASLGALALQGAPDGVIAALHAAGFWGHTLIVLVFLNFLPYGKHFHILTVLPNVLFRRLDGVGRLKPVPDIEGRLERSEPLGVTSLHEFSWKDMLDFYTCTECGRCSDHCPAFNTGKLLSPKHLSVGLRDYAYAHQEPAVRFVALDALKQRGMAAAAPEPLGPLVPEAVDPEMLWACTSCGACEQECPVFITYVDKIVGLRRHLVMERGEFPEQLQTAFRGLETAGNPYSFPNEQRAEWAAGLDVPLRADKPDAEYLFFVGCAPSFDDRSRRIARATAQLLIAAKVDFAILGAEETCNGDPARRAGNEYLYETLARQAIDTMNNYQVRKIITTCPHCFNILGNEYPDLGGRFEVIHHTQMLADLVRAGRLTPRHHVQGTVVFHDSCYLGRYNEVYEPPREILRAIPGLTLVEARESRDRGMCCGAGGAQMWKEDEPIRRPGSREGDGKVNHARVRQLLRVLPSGAAAAAPQTGTPQAGAPSKIASGCPFCKTMLSDGLKDQGHEEVEQADVAEYLWRAVQGS